MSTTAKKIPINLQKKVEIIHAIEDGSTKNISKSSIAKRFNIAKSTLGTIWANREKLLLAYEANEVTPARKRLRIATYDDVEEALLIWFRSARSQNVPINGTIIQTKALKLATELGYPEFKASTGWLDRFKVRHNITFCVLSGESASVSVETVTEWRDTVLKDLLAQYKPSDVYNADETGLFYRMLPDRTMAFKGESFSGGKQSKERLTVLVCSNMDGSDKCQLLVIGKFKKPRCFKNVKSMPVIYDANKRAWMTADIFKDWMIKMDWRFQIQKRKILMFVDNCLAHPKITNLKAIKLIFMPPNCTSVLQPMDMGIIKNLKHYYRRALINKLLDAIENDKGAEFKPTLLDSIRMLVQAWQSVTSKTLINCFHKAGFIQSEENEEFLEENDNNDLQSQMEQVGLNFNFENYTDIDNNVIVAEALSDTDIIEDVLAKKNPDNLSVNNDSDSDAEDIEQPIPTAAEATKAFSTVWAYLQSNDKAGEVFESLAKVENVFTKMKMMQRKQIKITDLFKK